MQKNPIIPYLLIMVFGLGLIFFLSIQGVDQKAEIAAGHEEGAEGAEGEETAEAFDPEAVAQGKCIQCHGGDLGGQANAPSLIGTELSKEEIVDVLANGQGAGMPAGLVEEDHLDEMADYILTLK